MLQSHVVADSVEVAEHEEPHALAAAHEMAARVALAAKDPELANQHADAAHAADPTLPVQQFVRGRLLYDEGKFDEAVASFTEATDALKEHGGTLADLHLYLGESLARLDQIFPGPGGEALATGAEDNGVNAALVIDVARAFKELRLQPRRTVRFVLFAGEEQGMWGSAGYVERHKGELDRHAGVVIFESVEGMGPVDGYVPNEPAGNV